MKNVKKIVALLLCAVLLVAGSVAGTIAYLTSKTEVANNTFSVGKVEIYLDETDIDNSNTAPNGKTLVNKGRDIANEYKDAYKLVPGCKHEKDPTVWIKEGSEESYVRMIVTVNKLDALKKALPKYVKNDMFMLENLVEGWNREVWECVKVEGNTYEFRYHTVVAGAADNGNQSDDYTRLPALFSHIKLPGEGLDNAEMATLEGLNVTVEAHAIQALGFEDDADAAWAAFDEQYAPNN